ncbi:MAG: DUF3164 family protein [Lachnospiraceae bacterium]|nr:DUF3164 family protein [Lachnospiraceae bacterium]
MSADERKEWEAFKAEKAKKEAAEQRRQARENYTALVDDELETTLPILLELHEHIKAVKSGVFGNFKTILDIKAEVVGFKENGQFSHTFTNSDSTKRVTLGVNTVDGWSDMAETGIAMVRKYLESLATDDKTKALVATILRLMAKDRQGNLNASKVLQLQKLADEVKDEQFSEGVKIIRESYQPTETRYYIRAQYRDPGTNAWRNIPLSITDVEMDKPGERDGETAPDAGNAGAE